MIKFWIWLLHNYFCLEIKKIKIVNILFSKTISDIYPSQQDVSGRSVRLHFDINCCVEEALNMTFGTEMVSREMCKFYIIRFTTILLIVHTPIPVRSWFIIIPPLPEGGVGILFYLCPSVRPSKIFFVTFFSVTVNGRNLIFGHKRHIGIPYCG